MLDKGKQTRFERKDKNVNSSEDKVLLSYSLIRDCLRASINKVEN